MTLKFHPKTPRFHVWPRARPGLAAICEYGVFYRISQELINKIIESMNSCMTDMIRNNGERLSLIKAVPFSIGTDSGLHYVKTMLVRFCDGLRHISYDFRLVLDGLRGFLTILAIR